MQGNMFFFVGIFILGVILLITSQSIDNAIKATCTSTKLRNSNKGILVIGMMFVVSSVSYLTCHMKCDCGGMGVLDTNVYIVFCLALGIVLAVLASQVTSESSGDCDVKGNATVVLIIGIIMAVGCFGYFVFTMYRSRASAGMMKKSKYSLRSSG